MDNYYLKFYAKSLDKICAGCKFCDFGSMNINHADTHYRGYDSECDCLAWDENEIDDDDNPPIITCPLVGKCKKFQPADKDDYIRDMARQFADALYSCPRDTNGKTPEEAFNNVKNLYTLTIEKFPPTREIKYEGNEEFFDSIKDLFSKYVAGDGYERIEEIKEQFKKYFYGEQI